MCIEEMDGVMGDEGVTICWVGGSWTGGGGIWPGMLLC